MSHSESARTSIRNSPIATFCAAAILLIHGILLSWVSLVNSPNLDEPAHLTAGISHWTFGQFELYQVNPPLVRMVAAIPILMTEAKTDWSEWIVDSPLSRSEFRTGKLFVSQNGQAAFRYFTLARWACIPLCLIGVLIVFLWARDLYGESAGLVAMWLYCFCPNCITWGASITPDAIGASFGVMAAYTFRNWLRNPSWKNTLLAGAVFGFAELTKGTWIILFVLWPLVWLIHRISFRTRSHDRRESAHDDVKSRIGDTTSPPFRQLAVILFAALYLLNLGFGFEGSFKRLRDYKFVSKSLSGQVKSPFGANRFEDSFLGFLPVPLPENYVQGLDIQKDEFERGKWSYLCGEQRFGGWWHYYLFAFLVKSPIAMLALLAAATALAIFNGGYRSDWRNELGLLVTPIAVLMLVSSQTGFNRYLRYALPILPFVFIHASRVAIALSRRNHLGASMVILCCLGTAVESLAVFPHSMSFFNIAAGGPLNGHAFLLDANIDWGQDLLFVKQWYDQHPEARPFHLAYFGETGTGPTAAGIDSQPVPGQLRDLPPDANQYDLTGPQAGWFAVSVNHIHGYRHNESDRPQYTYFQKPRPVARCGYSIFIYHVTHEQANQLRNELTAPVATETDR